MAAAYCRVGRLTVHRRAEARRDGQLSGGRAAGWMDEAFERGLAALLDGLIRAYAD